MATITEWPALGVEVATDRARTWVARASHHDGRIVVDLLDPIAGTLEVSATVEKWWGEFKVDQIAIDPKSPSATLVDPMRDAGMPLLLADAQAMAVAHGRFHDLLDSDRLRIRGNTALDEAARLAQERKLAGAHAVERYSGPDLAPLVAAELAVWALGDDPDGVQPGVW